MRKKRVQRKNSDEIKSNNNNNYIKQELISIDDSTTEVISDELLKRLSQGKRKLKENIVFNYYFRFCLCW